MYTTIQKFGFSMFLKVSYAHIQLIKYSKIVILLQFKIHFYLNIF